jgi:hypothetical protein
LAEPLTGKLAIEWEKVCAQLRETLPPLGIGLCHEIEPGHFIVLNDSRFVDIQVLWLEPKLVVRSVAPLTIGSRVDEEFKRFRIEMNGRLHLEALLAGQHWPCWADFYYPGFPYGRFEVDPLGVVVFIHTLMATSMDAEELAASIRKVLAMADHHDEEVVRRCGGTCAKQTPIKNVLPPRVLGLVRVAQTAIGIQQSGNPNATA